MTLKYKPYAGSIADQVIQHFVKYSPTGLKTVGEICQALGLGKQNISPYLLTPVIRGVLVRKSPTPQNPLTLYGLSQAAREQYCPKPRTVWQPIAKPADEPKPTKATAKPAAKAAPEPAPMATGTEARVCADIAMRQQLGLKKYGTTIEANPLTLREWLQHAYEECLDQANYLKRAIEELDKAAKAKGPRAKINCTTIEKEKP